MKWKLALFTASSMLLSCVSQANAALTQSYQFYGRGNWSLDAVGSNNTPVGTLDIIVPANSFVEKAFLYSTGVPELNDMMINNNFPNINFEINFDGTTYNQTNFTSLGKNPITLGDDPDTMMPIPAILEAFRLDVTDQVRTKIGTGGGNYTFQILSENADLTTTSDGFDGEALVVVYSNPMEKQRTIAFFDGFANNLGQTTNLNFTNPLNTGFEALLSLGIGFGLQCYQDLTINQDNCPSVVLQSQFSRVRINGNLLTSAAGGQDDGVDPNGSGGNGTLITIGGTGDDPSNPPNPNQDPNLIPPPPPTNPPVTDNRNSFRYDDEYYTLNSFLNPTGTFPVTIQTENPSNDDNLFFMGINITAQLEVPEPSSVLGLLFFAPLLTTLKKKKIQKQVDNPVDNSTNKI